MRPQPIAFRWQFVDIAVGKTALAMVPLPRYENVAKRQFGEAGSEHVLELTHERNMRFHRMYFAAVHEHYMNLPEKYDGRWKDSEHFRKWCLVYLGFYKERQFKTSEHFHVRSDEDYLDISNSADGQWVIVREPESQTVKGMTPERFEETAKAVLDLAEHFTGVPARQAMKEAGRSA